jgi:hypothetical protein
VSYIPLHAEPGKSIGFGISGRVDPATKLLVEPGFNQVFVDPVSGAELGKREMGRSVADHERDLRLLPLSPALHAAYS